MVRTSFACCSPAAVTRLIHNHPVVPLLTTVLLLIYNRTAPPVADCDDYISRTADPPAYDPATMALLMNGIFDNTPLVDIDLPASAKTMFWAIFMTPDSKFTAGQREAATETRTLEELCGETSEKTSKVKTTILFNADIFTINVLVVWVCNLVVVYTMTTYKVDVTDPDKVENSLLYRANRDIAMALSSREARHYWKNVPPGPHNHHIFCWLTNVVDTIFCYGVAPSRQPCNALLLCLLAASTRSKPITLRPSSASRMKPSTVLTRSFTRWSRSLRPTSLPT